MGINIGSIIGYLVCGWLQVNVGYHWAFRAATIGMGQTRTIPTLTQQVTRSRRKPYHKTQPTRHEENPARAFGALALTAGLTSHYERQCRRRPRFTGAVCCIAHHSGFSRVLCGNYLFTDLTDAEKVA